MNTDPIADFLTRIRNACLVGAPSIEMPSSKLKAEMAKVLLAEGYIRSYAIKPDAEKPQFERLVVQLKYNREGYPLIRKIARVSRPGMRRYHNAQKMPRFLGGAGIGIVSTNRGLMTDRAARRENLGGELMCYLY